MFGLGMPEILLILAIALIVIGPKKLPDLAKTLGRAMGEFKRSAQDFKASIDIDTTVKDITDLEPTDSKLKEALKAANKKASEPDPEDKVFTRETPDLESNDSDLQTDTPKSESTDSNQTNPDNTDPDEIKPESKPDEDSSKSDTNESLNTEKDDPKKDE